MTLRKIVNAPWYVTNHTLHKDLRVSSVKQVFQEYTKNSSFKIAKTFKPPRRNDPHPTKQKATKT